MERVQGGVRANREWRQHGASYAQGTFREWVLTGKRKQKVALGSGVLMSKGREGVWRLLLPSPYRGGYWESCGALGRIWGRARSEVRHEPPVFAASPLSSSLASSHPLELSFFPRAEGPVAMFFIARFPFIVG